MMQQRKFLLRLGVTLLLLVIVGLFGLNALNLTTQSNSDRTPTSNNSVTLSSTVTNRSIWSNKNIPNYTMTITTLWMPVPAVDVQIEVQNNTVTNEKLLECELGQSVYSANTCDVLTTYYYSPRGSYTYTIENLFERAESCTEYTKKTVAKYDASMAFDFNGFTSSDAMYDFQRMYSANLRYPDYLCSVEYDPEYGYPTHIITSIPGVTDGITMIAGKNFHVDE